MPGSLKDFINKYNAKPLPDEFIAAMDGPVAAVLATSWSTGAPVVGLLGPALGLIPGSLVIMPFLEADLTAALAAILIGLPPPGAPAVVPPITPAAMLALAALNPTAANDARALANAIVDWAVAQAPIVPPAAKGPPAPWPPVFIAV